MDLKGRILPLMVLVKDHEKETKTDGGIIIPDVADTPSMKGDIIITGEGTEKFPVVVKPGETVLFHQHAGQKVTIEGETYRLLPQKDILYIF